MKFIRYFFVKFKAFFRHRVEQLKSLGHSTDKVEFIVMGGTFMALPTEYRDFFIRNLHDALSGHRSQSVDEAVRSVMKIFFSIEVFNSNNQSRRII